MSIKSLHLQAIPSRLALIIENKLTTYYILGYNSESLKNNPMRNREVMRVMERVYNFSAGPSILPLPVLEKVQKELLNYNGTGMSIMEMSHRSSYFQSIIEEASNLLRELMSIPDEYEVLFLQGGASLQFSMIPLNLMNTYKKLDTY